MHNTQLFLLLSQVLPSICLQRGQKNHSHLFHERWNWTGYHIWKVRALGLKTRGELFLPPLFQLENKEEIITEREFLQQEKEKKKMCLKIVKNTFVKYELPLLKFQKYRTISVQIFMVTCALRVFVFTHPPVGEPAECFWIRHAVCCKCGLIQTVAPTVQDFILLPKSQDKTSAAGRSLSPQWRRPSQSHNTS